MSGQGDQQGGELIVFGDRKGRCTYHGDCKGQCTYLGDRKGQYAYHGDRKGRCDPHWSAPFYLPFTLTNRPDITAMGDWA